MAVRPGAMKMEEASTPPGAPIPLTLQAIQTAAGAAVVLFAALGAVFYFVGSQYLTYLAQAAGLASPPRDGSIQVAMAEGARVLAADSALEVAAVCLILALIGAAIARLPWYKNLEARSAAKLGEMSANPPKAGHVGVVIWLSFLAGLLFLSFLFTDIMVKSARISAYKFHIAMMDNLDGPCEGCRAYVTKSGIARGLPLFQSDSTLYVRELGGVALVPLGDLQKIRGLLPDERRKLAEGDEKSRASHTQGQTHGTLGTPEPPH